MDSDMERFAQIRFLTEQYARLLIDFHSDPPVSTHQELEVAQNSFWALARESEQEIQLALAYFDFPDGKYYRTR